MSMILGLTMLGDRNIERVVADPPLVWRVLAPEDPEAYERARRPTVKKTFWGIFFGRKRTPEAAAPAVETSSFSLEKGEGESTDLDKAWHGIHYLLTGTEWEGDAPFNFLLCGGRQVGDIDVGYGPSRAMTSDETRAAYDALSALSDEQLRARFKPTDMQSKAIYPEIWDRDPADDDTLEYLISYVEALRKFLATATQRNMGMVIYLT